MNPLEPIDQAPKDGDFARYVEGLVARSGQRLAAPARADGPAAPLAPVVPTPVARSARGVALAAGRSAIGRSAIGGSAVGGSTRGVPTGNASTGSKSTAGMPTIGDAQLPDLGVLLSRASTGLAKIIGAIGVIWLLLGIVAGIGWFADSLFIAMMLLFAAAFLHNNRRRTVQRRGDDAGG
ncbi:MAG: hypothetical protein QM766_26755 [Burkholderiaceae bacterium]